MKVCVIGTGAMGSIYGSFFGIIFFGETLEYFHYIGALSVFIGIYLVKKKTKWD